MELLPIVVLVLFPLATYAATQQRAQQCRTHIENTTRQVLQDCGRTMVVTSRHRDDSAAHQRGAIDIRSINIPQPTRHAEAQEISRRLPNHNVIVEERRGNAQTNTTYRNGQQGAVRQVPPHATATHIQPDARNCRPARGGASAPR